MDMAVAVAKARRLSRSVRGEVDHPWPVIWRDDGYSVTFARGPDPIGKPGGQYILTTLLPIRKEYEIWERTKHSCVQFCVGADVGADVNPQVMSAVAAEPPSNSRDNEATAYAVQETCVPTTSETVVALAAIAANAETHNDYTHGHVRRSSVPPVFPDANEQTTPKMVVPNITPKMNCDASPSSSNTISVEKNLIHEFSTSSTGSGTSGTSEALSEGDSDDAISLYSDTRVEEQWADAIRRGPAPSCSLSAAKEQNDICLDVVPAKRMTREGKVEQRTQENSPISTRWSRETKGEHATSGDDDDEPATGDDHERPHDERQEGQMPEAAVSKGSVKVEGSDRGEEEYTGQNAIAENRTKEVIFGTRAAPRDAEELPAYHDGHGRFIEGPKPPKKFSPRGVPSVFRQGSEATTSNSRRVHQQQLQQHVVHQQQLQQHVHQQQLQQHVHYVRFVR